MNDDRSAGGAGALVAVLLLLAIIGIAVVGLGAGFFLFSARTVPMAVPVATKAANSTPFVLASSPTQVIGTFALAPLDMKDQLEAPAIAITPQGHVLLAYASQTAKDERTLRIARSRDGASFEEPKEIRKTKIFESVSQQAGKEVRRPIRLLPQLATGGGKVFLGWVEPNEDNTTVFYYVAESTDDGETFGDPVRVHESDGAKPAFTGLAADAHGNAVASWLDSRAGIKQPFAAIKKAGESAFQTEAQVYSSPNDEGVCPCCPTAVVIGPDEQVHAAFRNQLDGFRDIYVGQRPVTGEGDFTMLRSVVETPTWKFDGCPHDGPTLAIDSLNLYAAWMDASSGTPRCYFSMKPLGGGNFTPPQLLHPQGTGPEGNARLIATSNGLVAVWEATLADDLAGAGAAAAEDTKPAHDAPPTGSSRAILMARGTALQLPQGTSISWQPPQPVAAKEGAFQTRPALALKATGEVFAAWHELDEQGKRVVVAKLAHGDGP